MGSRSRQQGLAVVVTAVVGCLSGCHLLAEDPEALKKRIAERGEIVVLTRNAPTTYYEGPHGLKGYEYELATAFARSLGVDARFVVLNSVAEILQDLEEGRGDFAAAGLTRTEARAKRFLFGPPYHTIRQEVVCHRRGPRPSSIEELAEVDLLIIADSSYEERLQAVKTQIPELEWSVTASQSTEQIMEKVWRRQVDCTVADSNIVDINRRYFPDLVVTMSLSQDQRLAWVLPAGAQALKQLMDSWFTTFKRRGRLATLEERYYGHVKKFDYVGTHRFLRHVRTRLPKYRRIFEAAADHYELPWPLLAAQAYQESHWRPHAKSPTGVRGIMMLTRLTASSLGIENRLDPGKSIWGGARYLAKLQRRLPDTIEDPDRTWIALAAYNVGMGHIKDARRLARRKDLNDTRWKDLKQVLPLLSQKQYYRTLPHGYARGYEPVRYVQQIRDYRDQLRRYLSRQTKDLRRAG